MLEIGWIVCRDQEREVVEGCVRCPANGVSEPGRVMQLQDCFDCRHLMAASLDREPQGTCATES